MLSFAFMKSTVCLFVCFAQMFNHCGIFFLSIFFSSGLNPNRHFLKCFFFFLSLSVNFNQSPSCETGLDAGSAAGTVQTSGIHLEKKKKKKKIPFMILDTF